MTILCESLSPGVAEGQLHVLPMSVERLEPEASHHPLDVEAEARRFGQHVAALAEDLQQVVGRLEQESLSAEADIVRIHLMMLHDRKFQARIEELIRQAGLSAHSAVAHVAEEMLRLFEGMHDPYLAERAADLRDLAGQLEMRLRHGDPEALGQMLAGAHDPVLVMPELLPSIVLQARQLGVRAVIVQKGTGFSHGAILARAFGIPAVRVADLDEVTGRHGQIVLVDGDHNEVLFQPTEQQRRRLKPMAQAAAPRCHSLAGRLWVSIIDPAQLEGFDWRQIQGVGLYRTETLYMMSRSDFPSEDEQAVVYRRLFELCDGRPVTIRTADLGGDKIVPYLSIGQEDNPYLGLRAHRLYRFHPHILITQVRAILRAAAGPNRLRVLYPMIESLDQWRFVQALVGQAIESLRAENLAFQERFEQGVLIETPSAVWEFRRLLERMDFAAVGTNDLVQYLFAVERGNANVADLYQPEHPVVLRVLRRLVAQARQAGKGISICGEVARNLKMLPLLVGLGLRDLAVGVRSVPAVLERLCTLQIADCRRLARTALRAESVEEVRTCLGGVPEQEEQRMLEGQTIDPVCRMTVRKQGNPFTIACRDKTYYFCSSRCMAKFANCRGR